MDALSAVATGATLAIVLLIVTRQSSSPPQTTILTYGLAFVGLSPLVLAAVSRPVWSGLLLLVGTGALVWPVVWSLVEGWRPEQRANPLVTTLAALALPMLSARDAEMLGIYTFGAGTALFWVSGKGASISPTWIYMADLLLIGYLSQSAYIGMLRIMTGGADW